MVIKAMVEAIPTRRAGVARAIMKYKATSHNCRESTRHRTR